MFEILKEMVLIEKEKPSEELQLALNLLKKLKVGSVRNIDYLANVIEYKEAFANVGQAKSIWRGKNGMPEGDFLFMKFGSEGDIIERDSDMVKREAGMSLEQALEVLLKAGVKQKKSLRKTFG